VSERWGTEGVRARVVRTAAGVSLALAALATAACGPTGVKNLSPAQYTNRGTSISALQDSVPPTMAGPLQPPAHGAYTGVYQWPAPFDMSALDSYEAIAKKPPVIVMWYQPWTSSGPNQFDPAATVTLYERGAIPMVTWEPWNPSKDANTLANPENQPTYRLSNIIKGKFDGYIRQFARSVKSVRGPVMIRLMHEMNGDWYPWSGTANGNSPEQFVVAWRHVHDIFTQEGATNVTWVWSVNHESVPKTSRNDYSVYYPGDKYVDWVSISGFNWGTSSPGTLWHPLDFWYKHPMAYLTSTGKPIVVSEFASVENGGDKAAWITDAYNRFRTEYPHVKAVVYYDKREWQANSIQDWRITTSASSRAAFRSAISNPYYLAAPAPALGSWTAALTQQNWLYLRSLKPVY
jgi:mannan endo-1,4-beta-mannosidase